MGATDRGTPRNVRIAIRPRPRDLADALEQLPPAQREAFSLLKLDGMSLEVAAARTGISVGALKVRAHRAYRALKKILGGND